MYSEFLFRLVSSMIHLLKMKKQSRVSLANNKIKKYGPPLICPLQTRLPISHGIVKNNCRDFIGSQKHSKITIMSKQQKKSRIQIQIPCFNEREKNPDTEKQVPRFNDRKKIKRRENTSN